MRQSYRLAAGNLAFCCNLLRNDLLLILSLASKYNFRKADWNLQFFRFRARRLQTTVFAFDALVYQNYESEIKLKSSPLDYVLSQLDVILTNWDSVLNASLQFLSSFVSAQ